MKKTIKIFSVCLIIFLTSLLNAQTLTTAWAEKIGSTGQETIYATATDNSGNLYVTGRFTGQVDFDPNVAVVSKTSAGAFDIFVAKYNAAGGLIWVSAFGGTADDTGIDLVVDTLNNNCYVTGQFGASVFFNPPSSLQLTSQGQSDIFTLKLDVNGATVWCSQSGWTGIDIAGGITLNSLGDVFITGSIKAIIAPADYLIFIEKMNSLTGVSMNALSAPTNVNSYQSRGMDIASDNTGNVYVTGYFSNSMTLSSQTVTVNGVYDAFIAKFNSSVVCQWIKSIGGNLDDRGKSITVTNSGHVISAGYFISSNAVDFNPNSNGTDYMSSNGNADAYISILDSNGGYIDAFSFGSLMGEEIMSVQELGGYVYVSGKTTSSSTNIDFDATAGVYNLNNISAFVAKYEYNGALKWVKPLTTTAQIYPDIDANSLSVLANGEIYIGGQFYHQVDFGGGLSGHLLNAGNTSATPDIFIWKLEPCVFNTLSIINQIACDSFVYNNTNYNVSDVYIFNYTNIYGCDSIIRLNLTVNNSSSNTVNLSSCTPITVNTLTYTSTGLYTQLLTNSIGCDSVLTIDVYIIPPPNTSTIINGNYIISLASDAFITYKWIDCNNGNAIIAGATSQSYQPVISGSYAVIVTNTLCGVSDTSLCVNHTITSVYENLEMNNINVYPNPANTIVTVSNTKAGSTLSIVDVTGKVVFQTQITNSTTELNVSELVSGIYFIQLTEKGSVVGTKKLVITK